MRRGCHGCQTKTKQNKKGSAQKYPQTEVNFFLEPKPPETAAWSKAASGAVRQLCRGQLPTRGPFPGSRDFAARGMPPQMAAVWLKKDQGTSRFTPSASPHGGAGCPVKAKGVVF